MDYKIPEERLKKVYFDYLNSIPELDAESHGSSFEPGVIPYYPSTWDVQDEFGDYESAPIIFIYYSTNDSYDYPTYEDNDFPIIEIDSYLYEKLISMFGEVVVHRYSPEWFTEKFGHEVKNIFAN
jgi:hypothetical protein